MKLFRYQNGNALVTIEKDGTRSIEYDGELSLDYPLNLDIKVTTACSLGRNPNTGKAVCEFCHESARMDGVECDYHDLMEKLEGLPNGIELAIGGNKITPGLINFLAWCKARDYICNLTVNQLHCQTKSVSELLKGLVNDKLIYGLGVSYRKDYPFKVPEWIIGYENTILHVIAGIDDVNDVLINPIKKTLVLGFKRFGFGIEYYDAKVEKSLLEWKWWVHRLFQKDVISFDNLALEQLDVKRFIHKDKWDEFNQGEHSFYIDAVNQTFSPSSRSPLKSSWDNTTIKEYYGNTITSPKD